MFEKKSVPVDHKATNALIRKVADKLHEYNVPSNMKVCEKVSWRVAKKWSPVKLKNDPNHVSMKWLIPSKLSKLLPGTSENI